MRVQLVETDPYRNKDFKLDLEGAINNPPEGYYFMDVKYAIGYHGERNNIQTRSALIIFGELPT
jgi:hypothetical protein